MLSEIEKVVLEVDQLIDKSFYWAIVVILFVPLLLWRLVKGIAYVFMRIFALILEAFAVIFD